MSTKTNNIKNHLMVNGTITSWEAITQYGATRLSAIIFNLRDKGWDIDVERVKEKDRNGQTSTFAKYILNPQMKIKV
jgi:hypothetical protein